MNQISSTRQLHYDLLRIFASFMVVMLHVSAFYWDKIQPQTEQWMALNLFDSAVRSCVPLFFMLSGVHFCWQRNCRSTSCWGKMSCIWQLSGWFGRCCMQ